MNPSRWDQRWTQIKSDFNLHEIVSRGDRWWCCRQPDTVILGFDVYVDNWGGISVDGDIKGLRFAYSNTTPVGRVHWIGDSTLTQYELEKASIGTGYEAVWTYNNDAAVADLRELADELDCPRSRRAEILALAEEAKDLTQDQVMTELTKSDPDAWEFRVGMIPTARVLCAHAAIARLSELLTKEAEP